jgi:glycosyltransferase involved in cell wall biosynthesis
VYSDDSRKKVGYILKKFPVLSETFILNELLELESQGIALQIFSLERPNDPRFHEDLPKLKARICYVPDFSDAGVLYKHTTRAAHIYNRHYWKTLKYVLRRGKPSLLWRFFQSCYIANQAKSFKVHHFHAHFATRPASAAFLASSITGVPYSFTAHAMDIFKSNLSKKSLAKKMRRAKFVISISEYNRRYLSQFLDGESGKIVRIYNGINLERFKPDGRAKRETFTFLCVARFVEKKGHRILIDACDRLRGRGLEFECWLVGKGKLRSSIKQSIKERRLQKFVKLLGPHSQEEVLGRCHEAHAYVLPCTVGSDGNRDGLPASMIEALACGLPVITTPMTGNPEVVKSNQNGLVAPFDDPEALASAMERIMCDRPLYERLKANARASVLSRFNLHETAPSLGRLFEESLK